MVIASYCSIRVRTNTKERKQKLTKLSRLANAIAIETNIIITGYYYNDDPNV